MYSFLSIKIFNKWIFAVLEGRTKVSIPQVNEKIHITELLFHSVFVVQVFVCVCSHTPPPRLRKQNHTKQEKYRLSLINTNKMLILGVFDMGKQKI